MTTAETDTTTTTPTWTLTAAEMSSALREGTTTSSGLVRDALDRIALVDGTLNAFVHLDTAGALAAAAASDARRAAGKPLGPLDGVPFAVKDNLFVAGMPATWGSRRYAGFVPDHDDLSIERLRAGGAVVVGKTNTPEFAAHGYTANDLFGVTANPFDVTLTPGGSSGGSAAAVAAGMVPLALGTDAGGSIRAPGSLTGLYGLRPTTGAVARAHGFPPLAFDFQAIGLLARTLDDLRMLFAATSGPDPRDPASMLVPLPLPVDNLRIGWFARITDQPVDDEVVQRVETAAATLDGLGWSVVPVPPPYDLARVQAISSTLSPVGATIAADDAPAPDEPLTALVAATVAGARSTSGVQYATALNELLTLRREVSANWGDVDVLVLPCTPTAAWSASAPHPASIEGHPADGSAMSTYAPWVNMVGYPGLSVPVTPYADGRPIGVQLVARPGQELQLFAVAEALASLVPTAAVPVRSLD